MNMVGVKIFLVIIRCPGQFVFVWMRYASTDAQPVLCQELDEHDDQGDVDEQDDNHQLLAREPVLYLRTD